MEKVTAGKCSGLLSTVEKKPYPVSYFVGAGVYAFN